MNKKIIKKISMLMIVLILFACGSKTDEVELEELRVIEVLSYSGTVEVYRGDSEEAITPYESMRLQSEDTIIVEEGSELKLRLDSDKFIHVSENSELSIEASGDETNSNTTIQLVKGEITNEIVNELSEDSSYEVVTQNATMSVRGTVYTIKVEGEEEDTTTQLLVFDGTVASQLQLEDGVSDELLVDKGFGVKAYVDNTDNVYEVKENESIHEINIEDLSLSTLKNLLEIASSNDELAVDTSVLEEVIEQKQSVEYTLTVYYSSSDKEIITLYAGDDIELTVEEETGYQFDGWYTDDTYTKLYTVSTMPETDLTIYAKYSAIEYTLSFENASTSSISATMGEKLTISTPTKTGYTFTGWYSDSKLTTLSTLTTMPAKDVTLYAGWEVNTYKIVFNSNGGSGSMSSLSADYDESVTLTANSFTRSGYTFKGWSTTSSGSVKYSNKETVSKLTSKDNDTITLYAVWEKTTSTSTTPTEAEDVTITFYNTNYSSTTLTAKAGTTLSLETPIKTGYTFTGWYSDSSLKNSLSLDVMPSSNTNAYAKYKINSYAANINGVYFNDGSVSCYSSYFDYGSDITLSIPQSNYVGNLQDYEMTRTGYIFDGWYTSAGVLFTSRTMPDYEVTITSTWTPIKYTVNFIYIEESSIKALEATYATLVNYADYYEYPTREGYTFVEWNTEQDGSGDSVYNRVSNLTTVNNGVVNLYAIWKKNE